jgi:hypothetical protein
MSDQRPRRLIHISFAVPPGVDRKKLDEVFEKATDWLKYAQNCWIVYSQQSADAWRNRLIRVPGMADANVFACELTPENYSGSLPQWMWDWFEEKGF